jgi:hypothetical protein
MTTERRSAVTVGILFIVGTVAGVICRALSGPYYGAQDLLGAVSANGTPLVLAAFCWLAMGLALAMIPVVMFPILRKQNEALALGYVVFRGGLETVTVIGGVVSWLLLLPLSQFSRVGSPDASSLRALGGVLLNVGAIGPIGSIVFCIGTMMFNFLLFRSRLIPRWISAWGFLGALPYLAAAALSLAGLLDQSSTVSIVLDVPLALQEMLLAVWFIAKGFQPTALASLAARKV